MHEQSETCMEPSVLFEFSGHAFITPPPGHQNPGAHSWHSPSSLLKNPATHWHSHAPAALAEFAGQGRASAPPGQWKLAGQTLHSASLDFFKTLTVPWNPAEHVQWLRLYDPGREFVCAGQALTACPPGQYRLVWHS